MVKSAMCHITKVIEGLHRGIGGDAGCLPLLGLREGNERCPNKVGYNEPDKKKNWTGICFLSFWLYMRQTYL